MRHAHESGRYPGRVPFGYLNTKDVTNKSIIIIDEGKALIIQKNFTDYLLGIPVHQIYQDVKTLGYTVKGNSAIQKVLGNCVYAGMIKVPAHGKRPERHMKALHRHLFMRATFGSRKRCWAINVLPKHSRKKGFF